MACANLGTASDFNVFLFGDYIQNNFTVQGRVAAEGSVTFQDQSVSTALPVSTTRADLIIGGDVNIVRGFNNGNTIMSPSSTVIAYTMINNNGVAGQPLIDTPVDFAAAQNYLQCLSTGWGALAPNGTAEDFFGTLQINGSDPTLNIISVAGTLLESSSLVAINVPASSTVLINVTGASGGFGNYQMQINGNSAPPESVGATIMWNFPQATAVRNANGVIQGTILAPFADMTANGSSQLNGQLIAVSYNGTNGGIRPFNIPFTGCLPEVTTCGAAALSVAKTVNDTTSFTGTPGTPITYTIVVTNTGNQPVHNIVITDDLLGFEQDLPLLEPGDTYPYVLETEVASGMAGTSYTNTVIVSSDEVPVMTASATVTIAALPINVKFLKMATQSTAMPGDQVIYQFSLYNSGNSELVNVRLVDPTLGLDQSFPAFFDGTIAETTFTIPSTAVAGSTITNTARLYADNLPQPGYLESSANVAVSAAPTVIFRKFVNTAQADPGSTIQYFFVIENTTASDIQNLVVSDPVLHFNATIDVVTPGVIVVLNQPYTIPANTPAGTVIENTATLTGSFGSMTASASVTVNEMLSLLVSKEESTDMVLPGETINYTIRTFNNGNAVLDNVMIVDELTGFQTTISMLGIGQEQDFSTSYTVPATTATGTIITNIVIAQSAEISPVSTQISAIVTTAPVPPTTPQIALEGFVSQPTAQPGDTVVFTGTVTNISPVRVQNLLLRSPFFEAIGVLEILEPGSTFRISQEFTVPANTPPGTIFTASLIAISSNIPQQETEASFVVIPEASFALIKSVNLTEVVQGEEVIFAITGRNTSNFTINTVRFIDLALNQNTTITSINPGSVITGYFYMPVTAAPGTVIVNEAVAVFENLRSVSATASYTVFGLLLNKQANSLSAAIGDTINYVVSVRNPTSEIATNILFTDPVPAGTAVLPGTVKLNGSPIADSALTAGIQLFSLQPYGTATITFTLLVISEPVGGSFRNQAQASFIFPTTTRRLSGSSLSNVSTVDFEDNEE
ncbi:choice-of-anchor A family protein [Paenibacillus glycanilyticus]|uniref:DUF11 domain-containing protein n=1 Tax=Paenibacillus glycanilyticus TaxID=126569 RepID=A0ABQ6GP98_9BACL|nr:collagen-binding domain-containing protein [Paenibacillus glycanilyticus]GLX71283.1 hypothetical protein MU1_56320 [Paenibacillus glycanilyticus]